MVLLTVVLTAEPRAGCLVGPKVVETVGLRANWTAERSAVLMASTMAVRKAALMAASRAASKDEKMVANLD